MSFAASHVSAMLQFFSAYAVNLPLFIRSQAMEGLELEDYGPGLAAAALTDSGIAT